MAGPLRAVRRKEYLDALHKGNSPDLGLRRNLLGGLHSLGPLHLGCIDVLSRSFDWRGLAERCACPLWTRSEVFPVEVSVSPIHVYAYTGNNRRTTIPLRRSRPRTSSPLTSVDSRH